MSETARSPGAQDKSERRPAKQSRQSCHIVCVVAAKVADEVQGQVGAPALPNLLSISPTVVQQYEVSRPTKTLDFSNEPGRCSEGRIMCGDKQNAICLTEAKLCPLAMAGFRAVDNQILDSLGSVEPMSDPPNWSQPAECADRR